ncbi:hypothetical protein QIH80_05790 [Bradyrhizobium elkanii]|jgi:hypothetical protein|nr:hypothetical protein QIH80_05790 [Bradyrhizobium elkanii]
MSGIIDPFVDSLVAQQPASHNRNDTNQQTSTLTHFLFIDDPRRYAHASASMTRFRMLGILSRDQGFPALISPALP